jgi:CrcB protein
LIGILHIALGGLLGTLARYGLQGWIQARAGASTFPLGTLSINVLGSLVLGFLVRYATGAAVVTPDVRAGLTVGFCGAFTTMSTFGYETMTLLADGQYWRAALYMGGSVFGCVVAVFAGTALANRLL